MIPFRDLIPQAPAIHSGNIAADYAALLARTLPDNALVIGDSNTLATLPSPLSFPVYCFDASPKATTEAVDAIRHASRDAAALIAVGSGTLNDLTKYASFLDGKPYAVIATAPSMNGYVSANASISEGGHKHTLPAHSPVAVLADIPTLAAAPLPLIQAGIGDTLCRSTVQADWLLSHLLRGTPYEPMYFEWMKEGEEKLLSSLRGGLADEAIQQSKSGLLRYARNDEFVEYLFNCLLISGFAMLHCGSSTPASQGEHMIAHTREMLFPDLPSHFHGLEIAVTTLTMARIQDRTPLPPEIRQQIDAIRLPTSQLEAALKAAGCPTTPADLGWPEGAYAQCIAKAPLLRNRFTFLNLLETSD